MMNEDFEREFEKDSVYLLEARAILEKEFWDWYNEVHRLPAKIEVINESKTLKNESEQSNPLPF